MGETVMTKAAQPIEEVGLGPYLRRKREERQLSLRQISDETRIRTYYLEGIEAGELGKLPPLAIARGFVRAFAISVGADPALAARQFDLEVGCRPEAAVESLPESKPARTFEMSIRDTSPLAAPTGGRLWVPVVAVLVFVFLSGLMLWFLRGNTDRLLPVMGFAKRVRDAASPSLKKWPALWKRPGGDAPTLPSPSGGAKRPGGEASMLPTPSGGTGPASSASSSDASPPPPSRAKGTAGNGNGPAARPPAGRGESGTAGVEAASGKRVRMASAAPMGRLETDFRAASAPVVPNGRAIPPKSLPLSLKVYAIEDTWLRVAVDSDKAQEILLMAGNEKKWQGMERFTVTVGNVAGTQISLNGTQVPLPQNSSNVLRDFVVSEKNLN